VVYGWKFYITAVFKYEKKNTLEDKYSRYRGKTDQPVMAVDSLLASTRRDKHF